MLKNCFEECNLLLVHSHRKDQALAYHGDLVQKQLLNLLTVLLDYFIVICGERVQLYRFKTLAAKFVSHIDEHSFFEAIFESKGLSYFY